MAEKKVFHGTNIGQVNISVYVEAKDIQEAKTMLTEIIPNRLPDLTDNQATPGIKICYSIDETFEETEIREVRK